MLAASLVPAPVLVLGQSTQPAEADAQISLNFPDNLELKVLVDYVAQRLGINILYDEQIASKRVTIKAPVKIPKESLLGLLESALKMKGLALVDAEQPGWKRIVGAADLMQAAPAIGEDAEASVAVTEVFTLEHRDPKRIDQLIKPFLTQPGGNTLLLPEQSMIVVTDYATNMKRIGEMVRLADQPRDNIATRFVPVRHLDAAELAQQVTALLLSRQKALGEGATIGGLDVAADARTNQVVLTGTRGQIEEALDLMRSLDVPLEVQTKAYEFRTASAERVDRIAKELIGSSKDKRLYRSVIDKETGLLIVTAPAEVQERVVQLQKELDQPPTEQQSPVRIYKLENAKAAEVLNTIRALEEDHGLGGVSVEGLGGPVAPASGSASQTDTPSIPTTAVDPATASAEAPTPPALQTVDPATGLVRPDVLTGGPAAVNLAAVRGGQATVTADANTNSIIVVAPPEVQAVYEQLIRTLDRRRPQVLVEITVVTIDTSRGFNLGVEIIGRGTSGATRFLNFTSFGLSEVDPNSGQVTLTPGLGFNGAVLNADVADIVIQALSTNSRARVSSAPKLLVNDNATGTLTSVSEAPVSSLNASDTVATTSFAGFVSAGTTITVTPHISEGDHLQLEYAVALNNFTGEATTAGDAVLPPPRQTSSVNSQVTIPDGNTIVVGGLNSKSFSEGKRGVPILGDIPVLEYLFSSRQETASESTLFVFIRPVILRDDQFKDLKFLSDRDAQEAGIAKRLPTSVPMSIR